jgi:ABC-2 type transport system ATP-binding protein
MIEIQGLGKVIENRTVLDIPSLTIRPGEVIAVVGPAESGTSVLLSLLLGKLAPTTGSVRLAGYDPQDQVALSRLIGVLFPDDGLYLRQTARQNLAFHASLHNLEKDRILETLNQVGLADHADIKAEKLASGLKRRLAFGRSILHHPSILILVDPFARCDGVSIGLLSQWIRQAAAEERTVLILADDNAHLHPLCDCIHRLDDGRIVESYDPKAEQQEVFPFKIPVRQEGKVTLVNPADILYADASEGKSTLQTHQSRLPTQFTLNELEERLARSGFFRAHRSYLVNLQHVKEVIPYTRNSFSLRLDDPDNTEIPLSKSAAAELRELLGY